MTQRDLARASGVPQPTIARIERGLTSPRLNTLERLLEATGTALEMAPATGAGVDASQIRELLNLTPGERARLAAQDARNLERLMAALGR